MKSIHEFAEAAIASGGSYLCVLTVDEGRKHTVLDTSFVSVELTSDAEDFIRAYGLSPLKTNKIYPLKQLAESKN